MRILHAHFWVSPISSDVHSRLWVLGAGLPSAGLGSCSAVTGGAHLTRTGVVPHLTRTEVVPHLTRTEVVSHLTRTRLLRLVNAFGRACLGFMPLSSAEYVPRLSSHPLLYPGPPPQSPGARRRLRLSPGYFECFSVSRSCGRWRSAPSAPNRRAVPVPLPHVGCWSCCRGGACGCRTPDLMSTSLHGHTTFNI